MDLSDVESSIDLWKNTKGLGLGNIDTVEHLSLHIKMNLKHNFIAFADNRIVGTVLGGYDGRRGYIYHLAVDENYRKRNIGRELMENCFRSFREINVEKCHMMEFKANRSAQDFNKTIGCTLRDDVVVFTKTLEQERKK